MKRAIYVSIFCLFSISLSAQAYVEGQPLDEVSTGQYLRICEVNGLSNSIRIGVDYGQEIKQLELLPRLTDEKGKHIRFNSITHALNHLYEIGWELVNSYGTESDEYFLLQRRKEFN